MSLPETIWFCQPHNRGFELPAGDTPHGFCEMSEATDYGEACDLVELRVAGRDDLLIRREDGKWPESATTTLAAAFINNERGVGQHPDVVLDLLAAAEGGET